MSFQNLLIGLLEGSALVVALWCVLRLTPKTAPDTRAWLWRIALLKLALPFLAISQITLNVLPAIQHRNPPPIGSAFRGSDALGYAAMRSETSARALSTAGSVFPRPQESSDLPAKSALSAPLAARSTKRLTTTLGSNLVSILFALWGIGLVSYYARGATLAVRAWRALRREESVSDPSILPSLSALSKAVGLPHAPKLVSSQSVPGPMVFGVYEPIVVLPEHILRGAKEDRELALAHEISHIRRRDLFWSALAWAVRSAFFFNPLAWLSEAELRAAQESATDQEAVWLTGASVQAYGEMLLVAMSPGRVAWRLPGLAMFDSFRKAQRRILAMRHFTSRPSRFSKLSTLVLGAIGIGLLPTYLVAPAEAAAAQQTGTHQGVEPMPLAEPKPLTCAPNPGKPDQALKSARLKPPSSKPVTSSCPQSRPQPAAPAAAPRVRFEVIQRGSASGMNDRVASDPILSTQGRRAAQEALDQFNFRVDSLIRDQDARIAEYRVGADQREREAEQREREGQQRKREGEQRARAALLREQVIEANERDGYRIAGEEQRAQDQEQRKADAEQKERDAYQGYRDQRQKETDQWQRDFDARSIAAMRTETQKSINVARNEYKKRLQEIAADERAQRQEAAEATSYAKHREQAPAPNRVVKTPSGIAFEVPAGYRVKEMKATGKGSYTIVLSRTSD